MSWNLLIYKPGPDEAEQAPMGTVKQVSEALSVAFPGLQWDSPTECSLPVQNGFIVTLKQRWFGKGERPVRKDTVYTG